MIDAAITFDDFGLVVQGLSPVGELYVAAVAAAVVGFGVLEL